MSPIQMAERGLIPDWLLRIGMRRMMRQRLDEPAARWPHAERCKPLFTSEIPADSQSEGWDPILTSKFFSLTKSALLGAFSSRTLFVSCSMFELLP